MAGLELFYGNDFIAGFPMTSPDHEDRQTIRLLGRLLGEVIRESHGDAAYFLIEEVRRQVVGEYRSGGEAAPMDRLTGLKLEDILRLIRGFSVFSQLANIADDHVLRRETRQLGSTAAQRMELHPGLTPARVRAYLANVTELTSQLDHSVGAGQTALTTVVDSTMPQWLPIETVKRRIALRLRLAANIGRASHDTRDFQPTGDGARAAEPLARGVDPLRPGVAVEARFWRDAS